MNSIITIFNNVKLSWSMETAYNGSFDIRNPCKNQCAVTALLLSEICGYKIFDTMVGRTRHFFNKDDSGNIIDLTAEQFNGKNIPYESGRERNPKDLLRNKNVKIRFEKLKENYKINGV